MVIRMMIYLTVTRSCKQKLSLSLSWNLHLIYDHHSTHSPPPYSQQFPFLAEFLPLCRQTYCSTMHFISTIPGRRCERPSWFKFRHCNRHAVCYIPSISPHCHPLRLQELKYGFISPWRLFFVLEFKYIQFPFSFRNPELRKLKFGELSFGHCWQPRVRVF